MFRHTTTNRTLLHNVSLASTLSVVAGIVNAVGILHLNVLTTNVTGHFAFFSEKLTVEGFYPALVFFYFIGFFLLGAFISSLLVELMLRYKPEVAHTPALLIEFVIITAIGISNYFLNIFRVDLNIMAFLLLFTMGLQNSLVSKISHSVVRTTHLTGLFTDLSIELSQLFFYKTKEQTSTLKNNIFLKITIILSFFLGGVLGGLLYSYFSLSSLLLASLFLLAILLYDNICYLLNLVKKGN